RNIPSCTAENGSAAPPPARPFMWSMMGRSPGLVPFPSKGELVDCTMLSNRNVVFSRQFGASEVTPDKRIVWNYDSPPATEIHTAYPIDTDRVLIMQNGNPAKLLVINKTHNKIEKELTPRDPLPQYPWAVPSCSHDQGRDILGCPLGPGEG